MPNGNLSPQAKKNKMEYIKGYAKQTYSRLSVDLPKEDLKAWKERAKAEGKSMRAFLIDCVSEHISSQ